MPIRFPSLSEPPLRRRGRGCGAGLVLLAAASLTGPAGCGKDPGPMTWKELQPLYFSSLNLGDEATAKALPDYEQRLDAVASGILTKLDNGDLTEDVERADAGLALLYQGLLLQVVQHGIEDGYLKAADFLRPQHYAGGGGDTEEEYARLARAAELLKHAAELRPGDTRLPAGTLAVQYSHQVLDGKVLPSLQLDMLTAARVDLYTLLATMILWRDADTNPANAAYMTQLLDAVCAPDRFNCNSKMPPSPPPRPIDGERKLTQEVNGPLLAADLLIRRAEAALQMSDSPPYASMRSELVAEAQDRLQFASGLLGFVKENAAVPQLMQYPATSHLPARDRRIADLTAAAGARAMVPPPAPEDAPPLPDTTYYSGRDYRAAYQCTACHTKGPTTMNFPK